jgi:hypothetical protein
LAPPPRAVSPDPRSLAVPAEELSRARELVVQLGSEDFRRREEATEELTHMGRLARPVLLEAVNTSPDPEVRLRCSELLPKALDSEIQARLATLRADVEGRYDHDIPGLRLCRKHIGTSPEAHALTVTVLRYAENRAMFAAIERGPLIGGRAVGIRRRLLYDLAQPRLVVKGKVVEEGTAPILEYVAAILLAEIELSSDVIVKPNPNDWVDGATFIGTVPSNHAIAGSGPHHEVYQELVVKWLSTRKTASELSHLDGVLRHPLGKFRDAAFQATCRILTTPGITGPTKCGAMRDLVLYYTKEEITPVLSAALDDDSVVVTCWLPAKGPNAKLYPCRIKDVALAFLLFINKQDIDSYGLEYDALYGPGRFADHNFICHAGYVFRTEERRQAAMMRFAWWRLKQSLP